MSDDDAILWLVKLAAAMIVLGLLCSVGMVVTVCWIIVRAVL